jgi:3-oxoacyl-[acyl-carrier protein] reductase
MDLALTDKVVFITGGSRGIGRAAALRYAGEGARVAFSYHADKAQADDTAEAIVKEGGEALVVRLDLADPESMTAAVAEVGDRWGGIDVFVANAVQWASSLPDPKRRFEDTPPEEWRGMLQLNLMGTIASVQAVLPAMRGRPDGRIVLVSSDVSRRIFLDRAGMGIYGAGKAALTGLLCGLVSELGGDILVNIVMPGFTVTERNLERMPQRLRDEQASHTPTHRLPTPDDVARAIVFLGSPANSNITAEILNVTGGQ